MEAPGTDLTPANTPDVSTPETSLDAEFRAQDSVGPGQQAADPPAPAETAAGTPAAGSATGLPATSTTSEAGPSDQAGPANEVSPANEAGPTDQAILGGTAPAAQDQPLPADQPGGPVTEPLAGPVTAPAEGVAPAAPPAAEPPAPTPAPAPAAPPDIPQETDEEETDGLEGPETGVKKMTLKVPWPLFRDVLRAIDQEKTLPGREQGNPHAYVLRLVANHRLLTRAGQLEADRQILLDRIRQLTAHLPTPTGQGRPLTAPVATAPESIVLPPPATPAQEAEDSRVSQQQTVIHGLTKQVIELAADAQTEEERADEAERVVGRQAELILQLRSQQETHVAALASRDAAWFLLVDQLFSVVAAGDIQPLKAKARYLKAAEEAYNQFLAQ